MAIQNGEKMPSGVFSVMTASGPGEMSTDELFDGKKVVLVSVPGAFTPTCSAKHLPGFVDHAAEIKGKYLVPVFQRSRVVSNGEVAEDSVKFILKADVVIVTKGGEKQAFTKTARAQEDV